MSEKSIGDFLASTCELATPRNIFIAIYSMSNGNPCKGCAYDEHQKGGCPAKRELFAKPSPRQLLQAAPETVRELAERLGVSLSEARRMRRTA